jgi:hypothetical protein
MTEYVRARGYPSVRADRSQHPASPLACVADILGAMSATRSLARVAVGSEAGGVSLSQDRTKVERPLHRDGLGALHELRQCRQAHTLAMQGFLSRSPA